MKFAFTKMNDSDARSVLAWRYEPPYDFYNTTAEELEKEVGVLTNPKNSYVAVREDEHIIAYYCFGTQAQVDGGDYSDHALDIGGGAHPDITGKGFGSTFIQLATDFAGMFMGPKKLRITVAAFNHRALKMCENAGFKPVQTFVGPEEMEFVVLIKDTLEEFELK